MNKPIQDMRVLTLNQRQEAVMVQACEKIATQATMSDIPIAMYMQNLQDFILIPGRAGLSFRNQMQKARPLHYRNLIDDEAKVLTIRSYGLFSPDVATEVEENRQWIKDVIATMTRLVESFL